MLAQSKNPSARPVIEAVEPRTLFAANLYNVFGTEGNDYIRVSHIKLQSGTALSIRINNNAQTYINPDAAQVKIAGKGGNDTIVYRDGVVDGADFPVLIYGDAGNDVIHLGSETGGDFNVTFLEYSTVNIDGGAGSDRLVMDSSKAPSYAGITDVTYDYISLRGTAPKQYYQSVETIDMKTNPVNTSIRVKGLKPGTTLNITGTGHANTLYLGDGSLSLVQGRVNFDGVSGSDNVIIDDSKTLFGRTYNQYAGYGTFGGSGGSWAGKNIDSLKMLGTQASDTFRIFGIPNGQPTTIQPNLGFDTLEIGGGNYVANIRSAVNFWDDTGNTGKVVINDSVDNGDDAYTLTGGSFSKAGAPATQFAFAKRVELQANSGANNITVTPSSGVEFFLDGNAHSAAGDKLQLNLAAGEVAVRTGTGDSGSYLFANKKSITFQEIEDGGASQNLPTLSIDDQVLFEGTGGVNLVTFTVKLSSALFAPVGVDVAAVGNTAIQGSDFTATGTRLTFAAGETSKTFTAVVFGDTEVESDESFFVNLTNATNATVLKGLGFGVIINDDTLVQ